MNNNINRKELPFYIDGACKGKYTLKQVSESTGLSIPRISVLKREYKKRGSKAFIHGNCGRKPATTIPEETKAKIINIYKKEYIGFNFAFFKKCLAEFYDIKISYRSVYNILTNAGLKSPEKRRVKKTKIIHRPRFRRQNEGDMMQIDATPYDWFGTGMKCALHGGIDDATGKITGLYMCENECLYGYLEMIRQGDLPREIYSDRSAIFCVTPRGKDKMTIAEQLDGEKEKRTQWQRIMSELHINQILAHSPQAKGRIERLWRTLKGRLPWYFKHYGIKTIEEANDFLKDYIVNYNKEFAVSPAKKENFYRKKSSYIGFNDTLCAQFARKTDVSGAFLFHGYKFQLLAKYAARKPFTLYISEQAGFRGYIDGEFYPVKLTDRIQDCIDDSMPQVVKNIVYKYFYVFGKRVSA